MTALGSLKLVLEATSTTGAVLQNIETGERFDIEIGDGIMIELVLDGDKLNVEIETYFGDDEGG